MANILIGKLQNGVLVYDWDSNRHGMLHAKIQVDFLLGESQQQKIKVFSEILEYLYDASNVLPKGVKILDRLAFGSDKIKSFNLRLDSKGQIGDCTFIFVMGDPISSKL